MTKPLEPEEKIRRAAARADKSGRSKQNYIDPKVFGNQIKDYVKKRKIDHSPLFTNINLIIEGFLRRYKDRYVLDDMENAKADCMMWMIKKLDNYDPNHGSNPFNYFTTVCCNYLRKVRTKEGRERELNMELFEHKKHMKTLPEINSDRNN